MDDLQRIENFFNEKTQLNGYSIKSLDWGSRRTQQIRFHIFSEIASLENKSILDVGCGFGDFFDFLNINLGLNVRYTGVDISSKIVAQAKERNPNLNIVKLDILSEEIEKHDYVFGSGIHNIKVEKNDELLERMLNKMFELCNYGVATNMINKTYENSLAEHIYGYELSKVMEMCKKLTPFSVVRQDYLPNDFTLYLYKHDWATRSNYEEK
ncbi:MAG: class I SAM-dependent methyltransferase [Sulfurimonas sp.]|jgi:SAM-dependent methyltransferase